MVMWFFAPGESCGGYGRKPCAEDHRRVLFEIGGTARTLFGKDKKRRKPDTGQNAAARCFLTNLKLLT